MGFIGEAHMVMQFNSDNTARVHPKVWAEMQAADSPDKGYDGDSLSQRLDAVFSDLFGRPASVLWTATGTSANCLALGPLVQPHGGVVCHREAHIETDECGAPGFYLHGAKLMLAEGAGAKLTPDAIEAVLATVKREIHQVPAQAISLTQATEYGLVYRPEELAAIGALARDRGLGLHLDGARFSNAVAFLGCSAAQAAGPVDVVCYGGTKNGGMDADAVVFFDPEHADHARWRRKRAGHLQSKGRFLAAQLLALVEGDLWLSNARAANLAAQEIAAGARERLMHPVEANEVFLIANRAERESLRAQGFAFYDWDEHSARLVASWDTLPEHATALGKAIAAL